MMTKNGIAFAKKQFQGGRLVLLFVIAVALSFDLFFWIRHTAAQTAPETKLSLKKDDIGGVVQSSKGPEAGVWVIAETTGLPRKFVKIVVTDDQGQYLIPELPNSTYKLWVRGYGLVDSEPVRVTPGRLVNLTAVLAPSPLAAAQYYPADYWYSLMQIPPPSAFPIHGIKSQAEWINRMKQNMQHVQIGDKATREIPETLGKFQSSSQAWQALINSGESPIEFNVHVFRDQQDSASMYSDWIERIAEGAIPPAPPRPQGIERNVVISEWDWATPKSFIHDEISTDKRNPKLNANGPIYGLEQYSADVVDVLDPKTNTASQIKVPVRDSNLPIAWYLPTAPLTWGKDVVRPGVASLHSPMMDQKGRLWLTGLFRMGKDQPDYCKAGSKNPSAQFFPILSNGTDNGFKGGDWNGREVEVYDPETRKFAMIDTCFSTHHLEFAEDADNTLWFSGGEQVIGWLNTKVYDETGDADKAQGWCPYILDTNGNGKVDAFVGPDDPVDPTKDKRIRGGSYGLAYNPADGSIWEAASTYPGFILRISPGPNPPQTCLTEIYNAPPGAYNPKGIDVDRDTGLVWVAFATSGQIASFDRRKCKVLNGPGATGNQCPQGWSLYQTPAPKFRGVKEDINSDWLYLDWVDQFDTLGLGKNVPIAPGTNSDSTIAYLPQAQKMAVFRVPYPIGFYSRGMDGRIDDPKAGWKGKGLWATYGTIAPWHIEGGKGTTSKVVKFQVRPTPLAD